MVQICCLCGRSIEREDRDAVALRLSNLWRTSDPEMPAQNLAAHSGCFERGLAAKLAAGVPFDAEALAG